MKRDDVLGKKSSQVRRGPVPSFTEACDMKWPFGNRKGETLARIGSSDEGLLYLDWFLGSGYISHGPCFEGLKKYLTHPAVSLSVEAAIRSKGQFKP